MAEFEYRKGNIFESNAVALFNPVNCKGVMGKGLALQFKEKFPDNERSYIVTCHRRNMRPGKVHVFGLKHKDYPTLELIFNFPTKDDWRNPSKIEYIEDGMLDAANILKILKIESVAIPKLGCGLGGLNWKDVHEVIYKALVKVEGLKVFIYGENPKKRTRKKPAEKVETKEES